jgi:hypothetical protein
MACHGDMPCDAWVAEMPSSPTSVAVSKPQAEQKPERVYVPTPFDGPEQRAEQPRQQPAPGQQHVEGALIQLATALELPEAGPDAEQDDQVSRGDSEQEDG